MAVDAGLVGVGLSGPGLPIAAAQVSMAPLGGLIGSGHSGSSAAAGSMLGASAAPQVVLPAISLSGVQAGTLAIQSNAMACGTRANAPLAPASTVVPGAAWENGTPGQSAAGPVAQPVSAHGPSSGSPSSAGSSPVGPAPDPQKGGKYEPQWVLPPSKPLAPTGMPPWASSGPSVDEQEAVALGGDNQDARREIEELIKRLQSEGPVAGGYLLSLQRRWRALYDREADLSLHNDGVGACVSWVLGVDEILRRTRVDGAHVTAEGVLWEIESVVPFLWGNHVGVRITVHVDGQTRSFYMDNGWIGGDDHIFFSGEVPENYKNELPLAPWK